MVNESLNDQSIQGGEAKLAKLLRPYKLAY